MSWTGLSLKSLIIPGLSIAINLLVIAYGYGRLSGKVAENAVDIDKMEKHCLNCRNEYKKKSGETNEKIFTKLDGIQSFMNENFLKLSVQVAKLERDM